MSLKLKKLFVDGQTYVGIDRRTDRHLRPTLLGRLRRVDLKITLSRCHTAAMPFGVNSSHYHTTAEGGGRGVVAACAVSSWADRLTADAFIAVCSGE